jgi:ribosomal protein S18 acetylase RimI-like enzyme
VRQATEGDYEGMSAVFAEVDALHAAALPDLYRPVVGPARPREFFAEYLARDDAALFVAEQDGTIAGVVEVEVREAPDTPLHVPRRYGEVSTVVVRGVLRGRGIGRALMEAAERWARERGLDSLQLTVYEFNQAARDLYERLGYTTLRRTMRKRLC